MTDIEDNAIASFTEAARKNNVVRVREWTKDGYVLVPVALGRDWSIPALNFGYLDNVGRHCDAWDNDEWTTFGAQGLEALETETFQLPFERCFYMFHHMHTRELGELINLYELRQDRTENHIWGRCFAWTPSMPAPMDKWELQPYTFKLNLGSCIVDSEYFPDTNVSRNRAERLKAELEAGCSKVIAATMFLAASNHERQEPSSAHASASSGRVKGKLEPLGDILKVSLHRGYPSGSRTVGDGNGSAKRPHDRRGHYRKLKSGHIVPVKNSAIHGGGASPRTLEITR